VDLHKNLAHSTLASPPSGTDGTELTVATGHGTRFPTAPFNVTVWPAGQQPSATNAEIMRVTAKATDVFTVTRAQEGTSGRTHSNNAQIAATVTAKTLTDAEYGAHGIINVKDPVYGAVGDGVTDDTTAVDAADTAAASSGLLVPSGTYAIASNLTITSPITFLPGAKLKPASGVTVTISGQVLAGPNQQIFDISAGGSCVITSRGAAETFVTWWGSVGDGSTDCTDAFQACINNTWNVTGDTGSQARIRVPKGAFVITEPLIIGKNTTITGDGGANFATQLVIGAAWSGAALFRIEGALVTGGFAFRNFFRGFLIDSSAITSSATLGKLFNIATAYTITIEDIYVHNGIGTAISIDDTNDALVDRCKLFALASPRGDTGVDCLGTSSVTIRECDIEIWTRGIYQREDAQVTVLGGYAERNINQWQCAGTVSGSMTVLGGYWLSPGASGFGGAITGQNCTVIGGRYVANGGAGLATSGSSYRNLNILGAYGDVQTVARGDGSVSADRGDAAVTLTWQQNETTQLFNTAITADRAVTLSTTNARSGAKFRIIRGAGATGAFNINVGTGPLKALAAASTWCDVEYNGSAWILTAYGTL
jgi:hypothetical protein